MCSVHICFEKLKKKNPPRNTSEDIWSRPISKSTSSFIPWIRREWECLERQHYTWQLRINVSLPRNVAWDLWWTKGQCCMFLLRVLWCSPVNSLLSTFMSTQHSLTTVAVPEMTSKSGINILTFGREGFQCYTELRNSKESQTDRTASHLWDSRSVSC